MAQLVASMSGVVLGGVVDVVGSNLARGKIFTASIGSVDSLYPSVYIYIYIYIYLYILYIYCRVYDEIVDILRGGHHKTAHIHSYGTGRKKAACARAP